VQAVLAKNSDRTDPKASVGPSSLWANKRHARRFNPPNVSIHLARDNGRGVECWGAKPGYFASLSFVGHIMPFLASVVIHWRISNPPTID
jgi:hypothetical protein